LPGPVKQLAGEFSGVIPGLREWCDLLFAEPPHFAANLLVFLRKVRVLGGRCFEGHGWHRLSPKVVFVYAPCLSFDDGINLSGLRIACAGEGGDFSGRVCRGKWWSTCGPSDE